MYQDTPFLSDLGMIEIEMKKNNNKQYGLTKERQLKKILYDEGAMFVSRSRGSFGVFDLEAYFPSYCLLISCKATRTKKYYSTPEIKKIGQIKVPEYCRKQLRIWSAPHPKRKNHGWEIIDL